MRAPPDKVTAPFIPTGLEWVNVAPLRMDKQLGRPVLIEFWDFCRANSLRTLGYVRGWHERYAAAGLRVISAHAAGFPPSQDADAVRAAVARLGIEHPVVLDAEFKLWREFGNEAWPARYLFDQRLHLYSMHYGEGGYDETQTEICELLGIAPEPLAALRPEDEPGAAVGRPTAEREGAWSGPYEAGAVWAVLEPIAGADPATCVVHANGAAIAVPDPGCYPLVEHERHSAGVLDLEVGAGVVCHAVQFTPGLLA